MCDVSTKTIEEICQLLQCQPYDLMDWEVDLNPELSYENKIRKINRTPRSYSLVFFDRSKSRSSIALFH